MKGTRRASSNAKAQSSNEVQMPKAVEFIEFIEFVEFIEFLEFLEFVE